MTGEAPAWDRRGRLLSSRRTNQYDFPKACRRQPRRASAPLAVPPPRAATCCDAYPAPFTLLLSEGLHPLVAGLLALAGATVLTWRLNRAFTFDRSARAQHEEALRYAAVTVVAQSASYGVFAVLVSAVCAVLPQAAVVIGAAAGALVSYNGHRLFAFAPLADCPRARNSVIVRVGAFFHASPR